MAATEWTTCLIYRINKLLCVLQREVADRYVSILTRKNGLDEGRELVGGECALGQASASYSDTVGKSRKRD